MAFDDEGQALRILVPGQGADSDLAQARLVGGNEAFDGQACALQGVMARQALVVELRQAVVGQRLHAACTGAEHPRQVTGHGIQHRLLLVQATAASDAVALQPLEQTAVAAHQSLSSLPTSDRVKSAPMYLKCGRTLSVTRYQPGSPATSLTTTWAARSGRRLRTSGLGFSWSAMYWRIQVFSSRSRSERSFQAPICSRCSTFR